MFTELKRVASPEALSDEIPIQSDDDEASLVFVDSGSASTFYEAVQDEPAVEDKPPLKMSTEQKRVASSEALLDEIPNPKRIQTDDDEASFVNVDSGSASTSVNSACTSDIPQDFMIKEQDVDDFIIEDLIDGLCLEDVANEVLKDDVIVHLLEEFLETLTDHSPETLQTRALKLFYQAKNIFENHRFIGVLVKDTLLPCPMKRYNRLATRKLSDFLMRKMRSDPSFEDVLNYKEPATMMRNALSIWIGYWSNEYMLLLLFYSMGRRALGANYYGDDYANAMNEETTHLASGAFPSFEEDMPVCSSLIEDESIKILADELVKNPEAIKMAEELLTSLRDEIPFGRLDRYKYHVSHTAAIIGFWFDPLIIRQLIKALKESIHLVNVLKKHSKEAQFLRCVERVTRIQGDPLLGPILEGDRAHKMRGALSILFGYWSEVDVTMLLCMIFEAQKTNEAVFEFDVNEEKVEVLNYLTDGRGDVESLKNVLADKYCEDSVDYMDRLSKIKAKQEKEELESATDYQAIISVLLKNGDIKYFYRRRF